MNKQDNIQMNDRDSRTDDHWVLVPDPKDVELQHNTTVADFSKFLEDDTTNFTDQAALDLPRSFVIWNHRRITSLHGLLPWVSKRTDPRFACACCTQAAMFPPFKMAHDHFKKHGEQLVGSDTPHVVYVQGDTVTWSVEFQLLDSGLQPQRKWVHCVLCVNTSTRYAWWRIDSLQL